MSKYKNSDGTLKLSYVAVGCAIALAISIVIMSEVGPSYREASHHQAQMLSLEHQYWDRAEQLAQAGLHDDACDYLRQAARAANQAEDWSFAYQAKQKEQALCR